MPGGSRRSSDGGCSYRRKHRSFTWDEYFHHKTRKPKFYIGIPLILLIEFGWSPGYGIQVDIFEQTVENNSENMQEKRIKTCQEH